MQLVQITASADPPYTTRLKLDNGETIDTFQVVLKSFGLDIGDDISDVGIAAVRIASDVQSIVAMARTIAQQRVTCRKELARILEEDKNVKSEIAQAVAAMLEQNGEISDREFGEAIVRHYSNRGYGKDHIIEQLDLWLIDPNICSDLLDGITNTDESIDGFLFSRMRGKPMAGQGVFRVTSSLLERGFQIEDINAGIQRYVDRYGGSTEKE